MLTLPKGIIHVLRYFEEALSERVWKWAKLLLIGAILAPGERTIAAILRVMGQQNEKQFQNYHRGRKIAARGIYRDPVRSSKEFFVKTSGLR